MVGVQSIERAFVLLRALAVAPAGVSELADRVRLPKSTVARLLAALESEGAIIRDGRDAAYRIGPQLGDLAVSGDPRGSLITAARPFLVGLSVDTGESAGLDILDGRSVQFVDQTTPDQNVQVRDWTGESGPAHALPAGIAILAESTRSTVDEYLAVGLEPLTGNTLVDLDDFEARLVQVRSAGYAWGFEEFATGINSVAAVVMGPGGPLGALRVHGPTFRFPDPNRTHDLGLLVADAAARLSLQLGATETR